jgi:hypothetical protein
MKCLAVFLCLLGTAAAAAAPLLQVSENRRFLIYADGRPFFWLGDTAWELFHRLNREEADCYLENRARKGFTVIQAVAIAELGGHIVPNPYGHLPLAGLDPGRLAVKDGPDNDFWDHVDYIVNKAESLGMYIGLLPTWGSFWHDKATDSKPLFTPENAAAYGEWLGRRYKDKAVIWILGGDRPIENPRQKDTIRAMARGLRTGDGGVHLITFHPPGGNGSSKWLHDETWLDFNMRQNGHVKEYTGRYDATRIDYERKPIKPVVDGEPLYEDHPNSFNAKQLGHSLAADVRRPLYWDLFNGAFGHTYGHHSVWQMWAPGREPINGPLMPWYEAIDQPGAGQMQHARRLIESRPFLTRVPDDSLIVPSVPTTSVPGSGVYHFATTRDEDLSYALIYVPAGRAFGVRTGKLRGPRLRAWWFDPRNGKAELVDEFTKTETRRFTPPTPGELLDWVLVIDDVSKNYPPPGQRRDGTVQLNLP